MMNNYIMNKQMQNHEQLIIIKMKIMIKNKKEQLNKK